MIEIEGRTMGQVWDEAVARYGGNAFLACPADKERDYHPQGYEVTYDEAAVFIARCTEALTAAGYGHGHRIVLDMENRPEHFLFKLALNRIGVSAVPVNPDLRPAEVAYIFDDSTPVLAIVSSARVGAFERALAESGCSFPHVVMETFPEGLAQASSPPSTAVSLGLRPSPLAAATDRRTAGSLRSITNGS